MKNRYRLKVSFGFTLVELIVVITIVSILSTIGFVAYVDYLKGVRDSSRLQQISEIHGSMELYATRSALPLPDDNISIVAGTTQVGYQGVAGNSVLDAIRFSNGGKDPSSKKYFSYYLSADRKYAQLLAFFEEQQAGNLLSYKTLSAQYDSLYPQVYGSELGLLLEQGTNIPVHELSTYTASGKLDILSITQPVVSYLTNTQQMTGTGQALLGMIPNTSCKKIRDVYGYITTGIYKINPSGAKMIDVYCDMTTDGGGWTMIARSVIGVLTDTSFGWMIERGSPFDDTLPYSMGGDVKNIVFNEFMWGIYTGGKNIILPARKMVLDRQLLVSNISVGTQSSVGCISSSDTTCVNHYWGNVGKTDNYFFSQQAIDFYHRGMTYQQFIYNNGDTYNAKEGMIFIR